MYQALYRKWRPKVFSEVVGQEHITDTLRRQVAEGHTAHAYLFTGTRGTGKTTCARILAKAVNCLSPVDGEPCGRCEACRAVDAGTTLDITELDAATAAQQQHRTDDPAHRRTIAARLRLRCRIRNRHGLDRLNGRHCRRRRFRG